VVWFGELPLELDRIYAALETCALFVAIGPRARSTRRRASSRRCAPQAWCTRSSSSSSPSDVSPRFAERRHGPAAELVPRFVAELLAHAGS
jgi:NAD-dependent deacetylase